MNHGKAFLSAIVKVMKSLPRVADKTCCEGCVAAHVDPSSPSVLPRAGVREESRTFSDEHVNTGCVHVWGAYGASAERRGVCCGGAGGAAVPPAPAETSSPTDPHNRCPDLR
ncbi:unnamed protein product [Boreogadus saida]